MNLIGDTPVAGYYTTSLVRGGPQVPVRVWFGNAIVDGEEQDRGEAWHCEINGETDYIEKDPEHPEYRCRIPFPMWKVWPYCAKNPISEATYRYMLDKAKWAVEYAPERPQAQPRKEIDKRGASVF